MLLYLAGGNDGLNVLLPNGGADYAVLRRRAADRSIAGQGADDRRARSAPGRCPARAAPRSRSPTSRCQGGGGDNARAPASLDGASTRSTATAPAAPGPTSRSCPRSTPRSTPSATSTTPTSGSRRSNDLNIKTGWLGRWIDRNGDDTTRCRRSRSTPRSRRRSARRPTPCARSRRCRWPASRMNSPELSAARTAWTSTRRCAASRGSAPARATTTSSARASTYGLAVETWT